MHNQDKERLFTDFKAVSKQEWMRKVMQDLKGKDPDKLINRLVSQDITVGAYFTREELENTYGVYKSGDDNQWEIREDLSFKELHRATEMLENGTEALNLYGFPLDEEGAASRLFTLIDPSATPLHFGGVYSYSKLMTRLKKELTVQGLDASLWQGSFDFDYYAYYLYRNEFYHSFEANRRELKVLISKAKTLLPHYKIINVGGAHYHNAGASLVQETAFTLSHAAEYLVDCLDEGLSLSEVLPRMQFTLATGSSYFAEIAKLRAIRRLWKVISERFGASEEEAGLCYIHSVSSRRNKALYDPYVNLLRTTTEAMSAIIGGCDALTVLPFDAVMGPAGDNSRRFSRNQQLILKEEVNLYRVQDPAEGSYYIEKLTETLMEQAWDLFLQINRMGAYRAALEKGFIFDEIEKSAAEKKQLAAKRKINILGVNQFPNLNETLTSELQAEKKKNTKGLKPFRQAEPYEALRRRTERHVAKGHRKPCIFLLPTGRQAMRKARANFSLNFFGVAGFEVIDNNGFDKPAEGMEEAIKAQADFIVLCSSDDEYPALSGELAASHSPLLHKLVIAGYPSTHIEDLKALGIRHFIYDGCSLPEELSKYQDLLGIE